MKNDYLYSFFLSFFTCPHKRGEEIQTSDLQFMRRGHQPIELSLRYGPSLLYTRIHACIIYIYIYTFQVWLIRTKTWVWNKQNMAS
jgi:hypothetical protein